MPPMRIRRTAEASTLRSQAHAMRQKRCRGVMHTLYFWCCNYPLVGRRNTPPVRAQSDLIMSHPAALLPIDLPGAILDRLQRIDDSGRAVIRWANMTFVAPTAGMFQKAAAHARLTLIANGAVAAVAKHANDQLETLIWLRGAKAMIEESDDDLVVQLGEILPRFESLQDSMQVLREATVALKDSIAGITKSPSLRAQRIAAFHRYLAAQADSYAALEAVRWSILEREADADVTAGRIGQTFTRAADMFASLGE